MVIKQATQIGNKIIRQKAVAVKNATSANVRQTIRDLVDSMRYHNLVGMAAPQIGKNMRVFVSEIRTTTYRKNIAKADSLRVFINPKIIWKSKKMASGYEGCGSVAAAQLFGSVKRAQSVICTAIDEKGTPFKIKASGLLARIIQHETDHLNGIVFMDRMKDMRTLLDRQAYVDLKNK